MPEEKEDRADAQDQYRAGTTGEGADQGFAEARESPITIEQYEGANTWGDLKGISLRKLAEGLLRIEKRAVAIEERMATKQDLEEENVARLEDRMATKQDLEENVARLEDRMASKQDLESMASKQDLESMASKHDLTKTKLSIVVWNAGVVFAGVAIMAGVTFGILQLALS